MAAKKKPAPKAPAKKTRAGMKDLSDKAASKVKGGTPPPKKSITPCY
jgi:hypothetical protein